MRTFERPLRDRGSATVEFALVLPLVLVMALALVQLSVLVKDQLVVVESARAGARQASVDDDGAAREAAVEAASSLDPSSLEVRIERAGGVGSAVSVTVVYAAPLAVPLVSWLFPSSVSLSATATMRQEAD